MGKRLAIISVIILVSCLAVIGYFIQQGRNTLFTDPYRAVTKEACIVVETIDLTHFINNISSEKGISGEAVKINELNGFFSRLKFIKRLINKEEYKKLMIDGHSVISFYPVKNGNLVTLISMAVPSSLSLRHLKELVRTEGVKDAVTIERNKKAIMRFTFKEERVVDTAYISFVSGLMLCSNSEKLIEEAQIQAYREGDIRTVPGYSRVWIASGKKEDKVFLIFPNLGQFLKSVFAAKEQALAETVARLAGAAEGDIYIREDGMVFSGYTDTPDPANILFNYKQVPPKSFNTYKILPSSTVLFETMVLAPAKRGIVNDTTIRPETARLAARIRDFTGDEITRAIIDMRDSSASGSSLIIYELTNAVRVEQIFLDEKAGKVETIWFRPDDQVKIPVYKTHVRGLAGAIAPGFLRGYDETYFAFYDNFMISGNSFFTLSRLLYDNILKKTLANDLSYHDFESTLPSSGGYFFYCIPSRITGYLAGLFGKDLMNFLINNKNVVAKIRAVGYQFASSNGMLYNSLSIKYSKEEVPAESTTEWETLLDTVAAIKPFFFTNHNTGMKEIFIQDLKNNTYLINSAGRVLWKVPLNERINGSVYMVDYFHNGKFQLLFAGKNFLHLLDRNGNYVERYPVKLRSPATSPLDVVDFENNQNYRLYIAGEDKMIYSYDKTGNVMKGWKPFHTPGLVTADLINVKVSGRDYIVATDESSVYIIDRTGNRRVDLKGSASKAIRSTMRLMQGIEPYLVFSAPNGNVTQLYFDGRINKFSLRDFSFDHSFDNFDIDGDGFGEYIFIDAGKLYLYDHNRSEMFTRDFRSADLGGPINFIFSVSDRRIGVWDIDKKLIYLIDKNGNTMKGFPLKGASMFSIGKLSDKSGWHLIVGGTDRFLYNYKIDTETK